MAEELRQSVSVTIHGIEYRLSADADPAYIAEVAMYVDRTMADIQARVPFSSSTRLAILAGWEPRSSLVSRGRGVICLPGINDALAAGQK